jgi:hypothetical protein
MRIADKFTYAILAIGFGLIAWTAWSEGAPASPRRVDRLEHPLSGPSAALAKGPAPTVHERLKGSRPMYEYRVVRIPRLVDDEDDVRRHERMMLISYELCYGFAPYYGYEASVGYGMYSMAQEELNERDAAELGDDALRLFTGISEALSDWDIQMWSVVTFKYNYGAHGSTRAEARARVESVQALSHMLERIDDDSLAAAIKHPREFPFAQVKAKIRLQKPVVLSWDAPPLTPKDYRDYALLKEELIDLTTKLGQVAASLPLAEQAKLNDLLLLKMKAFDE